MAVDHAARAAQVARLLAHAGNANEKAGLLSWAVPASATRLYFAANIVEDKADPTELDRDESDEQTVRVLVAASAFSSIAPQLPRAGSHFTDAAGRKYRIQKILSPPYSALVAFRCTHFLPPSA